MKFNPLTAMGNHPVAQILSVVRNNGDPSAVIQQVVQNHPQRDQIQKIVSGKSDQDIFRTAENMCRERGTSIDQVLAQFGIER